MEGLVNDRSLCRQEEIGGKFLFVLRQTARSERNLKRMSCDNLRQAARSRHGLEARRNSFAGFVELNRCEPGRIILTVRAATIQQTMPGAVRQPTRLKAMTTASLVI